MSVAQGVKGRTELARLVAAGRLDLDHRCAVIGEHLRAQRPSEHPRQINHAQAGKGCARGKG